MQPADTDGCGGAALGYAMLCATLSSSAASRLTVCRTVPARSPITSNYLCGEADSSAGRGDVTSLSNALQPCLFVPYGVFSEAGRLKGVFDSFRIPTCSDLLIERLL